MINVRHIFRNIIVPGAFRIPKTVSVNGSIDASVSGRIDGNVRGDVKTSGKLVVSETASIRGHIYATDLVVHGKVYGDVYITNKAHISNKALVKGDVNAMVLEIEEGAVVEGAIRKNVLPVPKTDPAHPAVVTEEIRVSAPAEATTRAVDEEEQNTSWF
ncbi:bactofilin family protein [Chitinophaga arvensicola]|uniref:Polymer-forming protein n=1 Tax=Chitinophaga arvensicola TaxID=29529 RepID=A0A1I0S6A0_9BACT|nr:polymer-forming cytoskeletal protein [Chitinophaga arvensicola]SEW50961.1 Polymer-forming protein [Chitinophaga arvensicola]